VSAREQAVTMTGDRTPARRIGDRAEELVAERLAATGWRILARDLRVGRKEIDLLAVEPGPPRTLVIVEVRWRARRDFGLAEETFDARKRGHLRAALARLLEVGRLPDGTRLPAAVHRIDLVVVEPGIAPGAPPRVRHHRAVG
jgi:putative endonuclease